MFANLICGAERIRSQALATLAEYAVEVEVHVKGSALRPDINGKWHTLSPAAKSNLGIEAMVPGVTRFPRYSLGSPDEFNPLLNMVHRDFWHAFGSDFDIEKNKLVIED